MWRFRNIKPGGLRVLDKHLNFRFEGFRPAQGERERKGVMTEFRSGVKWEEWGERVLLEVDEIGELIEGECVSPKYLDWKVEEVGSKAEGVAWCFKPRKARFYFKTPVWVQLGSEEGEGYKSVQLKFEERLVCGHRAECEGQEVLDV